jgi:N-methylhydantoinase A
MVKSTRETWLGGQWSGHMTGLSSVDVRSIGTGGGSVAWIDAGGLLRVGPESAGADPGPACYGRGGDRATVTDAAAFLGYLDPDYFAGGRLKLDLDATQRVIRALAEGLGEDTEQAALGILTVASQSMVRAIQEMTVNEGLDPSESLLVAGGGAAGLNIVSIAREIGCELLIPWTASVLSASGAQYSDVVAEFSRSFFAHSASFDAGAVNAVLSSIDERAAATRARLAIQGVREFRMDYFVEARYPTQAWELEVALDMARFETAEDVATMEASFHQLHERVFAVSEADSPIECLYWKGRLTGLLDRPSQRNLGASVGATQATTPGASRRAYFPEGGWQSTPIFFGHEVPPGAVIEGPAIIEEATTTIVVEPDAQAHRSPRGHYQVRVR